MKFSVASSTVQAFSEKAGLPVKSGQVLALDNQFEVYTEVGIYVAKFLEDSTGEKIPVAKFYKAADDGSVKFLTREEASDLLDMIASRLTTPKGTHHEAAFDHLQANLPNLGFAEETPYMQERAKTTNAKNWAWSLNCE